MSKFCEKCGAEMDDTAVECSNCAEKEVAATTEAKVEGTTAETATTDSNKKSNKTVIFAGIGAVVIIAIIVLVALISGNNYKKPINNFFKGMEKADLDKYLSAFPEFMEMDENFEQEDLDEMLEDLEDEYGDKIKISYKILDKEKIDKEDLEDLQDKIEDYYDEEVKVKKGYELSIKSTIKGKDDEESDTSTLEVYKIDGKWCILGL